MQAYWLVVRVLLTPPAEAAASQKWKIIYLKVLKALNFQLCIILFGHVHGNRQVKPPGGVSTNIISSWQPQAYRPPELTLEQVGVAIAFFQPSTMNGTSSEGAVIFTVGLKPFYLRDQGQFLTKDSFL
jgi:hypothetical protein